uniref:Translationally-controlled tumor protein homolog n=1 Tax=Romanomermis culicivorax TaxID=13658 RepID=A0A915HQG1_ROMCU
MLIYRDIFSNDELCSDSFPMEEVDGVVLEFRGKNVTRKEGDIVLAGANPSAEEADEGADENVVSGIDVVLNHNLVEMPVYQSASIFKDWVKEYMKKLVDRMTADGVEEQKIKDFKTKMQKYVAGLLQKDRFKELQFFQGDGDSAADGQLAIVEYRNDVPIVMFIKQGLAEEKC